jgi:hypothetical protein
MFTNYSDEDLKVADEFTDAILKLLKGFDCGDSEVVGAQIDDMIKNYESASLELFNEIGNRADAKASEESD